MIQEPSWSVALHSEFEKTYFKEIQTFIEQEKAAGKHIFPKDADIFKALELTAFDAVKVVLLGQDPYHGLGQAHGLSFSVPAGVRIPPSLRNIFKELRTDMGIEPPVSGDLTTWAEEGVLLLNTSLTVEASKAAAHAKCGWQLFTDAVIRLLSEERKDLVFVLWGNHAQKKRVLIDENKHAVLLSAHPSPLSAYKGFFGSKPFSTANNFLLSRSKKPINWSL